MKKEIVDQMIAELNDTKWCQSDFEYDIKALKGYDGPFFWMVRENGTSLQAIGASVMMKWSSVQNIRFRLFRDPEWAIADIVFWNDKTAKYFYYDGFTMSRVTKEDIHTIWDALFSSFMKSMIEEHQDEYEMRNKPLEIVYSSEETRKRMSETLEFAKGMSDDSLQRCLTNLSKHSRSSKNHIIQIYGDFEQYSFGWSEVIDGELLMNGGIIYNEFQKENHWQIHS